MSADAPRGLRMVALTCMMDDRGLGKEADVLRLQIVRELFVGGHGARLSEERIVEYEWQCVHLLDGIGVTREEQEAYVVAMLEGGDDAS